MLPKSIASCSFSGMNLVPHSYFQGQKDTIYWVCLFKVRKAQFIEHIVHLFIQNLFSKYLAIWHEASPG